MKLRILPYCLALFIYLVPGIYEKSQAQKFSDNEIKTAFIYNFLKFTKWEQTPNPIKIGIVGNGDLAQTIIANLGNQKVGASTLDFLFVSDSTQLKNYDVIIYISEHKGITPELIKHYTIGKPVLTIGVAEDFVLQGGIISIVKNQTNQKKIFVNLKNLQASKITLSSKLLTLAQIIK